MVSDPHEADFILAHGTEAIGKGDGSDPEPIELDQIRQLLQQCADRGDMPLLVANPDIMTVSGRSLLAMPGKLGQWYEKMGGEVGMLDVLGTQLSEHGDKVVIEVGLCQLFSQHLWLRLHN